MASIAMLNLELPWSSSIDDDKRFTKILLSFLVVMLVISAVVTIVNLPEVTRAEKEKIPFQRAAASRATGTDTDAFAYSNEGVPSALISLPLRYMHTTVEMCRKEDVENTIRLIYSSLLAIEENQDFRYFK